MSLRGKRVLVTRAKQQSAAFVEVLVAAGAEPVVVPTIILAPPADPEKFSTAVAHAHAYDFIVFTSVNGVEAFFSERRALLLDASAAEPLRATIAAIGPATAEALSAHGMVAEVVPPEYRGEAVAKAIQQRAGGDLTGLSVLLPRAAGAREVLPEMLRHAGARVDVVDAYRALAPDRAEAEKLRELVEHRAVEVVTFTSSSTVSNTVAMLGPRAAALLEPLTVASIGPITTETAEKHALRVDVTATEYTIAGLIAALQAYYAE